MVVCGFLESTWTENGSDAVSLFREPLHFQSIYTSETTGKRVMAHQPFRSLEAMDPLEEQ